jgi:hypothetical protein
LRVGEPEGQGSGYPTHSWGSAGPERWWAQRAVIPVGCGTSSRLGCHQPGGRDPSGRGSGAGMWHGAGEGQVSRCGVGLVQPKRWGREMGIPPCVGPAWGCGLVQPKGQRAWQNRATALHTYRARIWQATCFIRSWCGEAFHNGFRVPYFSLSLVLYFSQACLQLLSRVSG